MRLGDHSDCLAGIHRLPLFYQKPLNLPGFGRTNFVLHFHGLHHGNSLPGLHCFTGCNEHTHYTPRHRRNHVLVSFR